MAEQTATGSTGIDLDLGLLQLKITLSLTGIQSLIDVLNHSLNETQGALQPNVGKVVDAINQLGAEDIRRWAEQGGQEARAAFNQLVSLLQQASSKGEVEAGQVLRKLGDKMQETGGRMESGEPGTRH